MVDKDRLKGLKGKKCKILAISKFHYVGKLDVDGSHAVIQRVEDSNNPCFDKGHELKLNIKYIVKVEEVA